MLELAFLLVGMCTILMGLYVLGYQGLGTDKCNIPDLGMDKTPEDIYFLKKSKMKEIHTSKAEEFLATP